MVSYNGNDNTDGGAPGDTNTYDEGASVTVSVNTDSLLRMPDPGTAEAFKFDGWNTQADGSGTDYAESATFTMGSADVTLYAKWVPFELRDTRPAPLGAPVGGLIFFNKGSFSDGWRYLEAAVIDQASRAWIVGGSTPTTLNDRTSAAIGTGQANSDAIVAQTGHTSSAAQACLGYAEATYDDWFLPLKDELDLMYLILHSEGVGNFQDNTYWSSTEEDSDVAWSQIFSNGNPSTSSKDISFLVRPIRAF